jgi:hypothetical protein
MRNFFILIPVFFASLFMTAAAHAGAPVQKEYVILSGGPSLIEWEKYKQVPHDHYWGNFIRTARVRIEELRNIVGPDAKITWMVYKTSYVTRGEQDKVDYIADINSVRDKYNLNLILFSTSNINTSEVVDYMNSGQPRDTVKIADFEYFGHSNKACWLFDYSNNIDSSSKNYLHEQMFSKLHRGIFTKDAFIKSWGCHTGEEMSHVFRSATGAKMWGAVGKTDYLDGFHVQLSNPAGGDHWVQ